METASQPVVGVVGCQLVVESVGSDRWWSHGVVAVVVTGEKWQSFETISKVGKRGK